MTGMIASQGWKMIEGRRDAVRMQASRKKECKLTYKESSWYIKPFS
jgi:hypothetical protein